MTTSDDSGDSHVTDRYFLELYESNDVDLVELILTSFSSVSHSFSSSVFEVLYLSGSGLLIHIYTTTAVKPQLYDHTIFSQEVRADLIEVGPQYILKGIYQIEKPRSPWRNRIATRRVSLRWWTEYGLQLKACVETHCPTTNSCQHCSVS